VYKNVKAQSAEKEQNLTDYAIGGNRQEDSLPSSPHPIGGGFKGLCQ